MDQRAYVPVRLAPAGRDRVQAIADEHHGGNRSAALRDLLRLGLQAWDAGKR